MREAELASLLGISRTPVREALSRLEADGLVEAAPRRGLVVTSLDQQQATELYAMRAALEGLASRLAATFATDGELRAMEDSIERQTLIDPDDAAGLAGVNARFHRLIYRAARNRYLIDVLGTLEGSLALLPGTTYSAVGRPETAIAEHRRILAALRARDANRAETAAREHIGAAETIRLTMLAMSERSDAR